MLETNEIFIKAYGERPLGTLIRSLVGLDEEAASAAFADILANSTLNIHRIRFIEEIIRYFMVNGIVEKEKLFEATFYGNPFSEYYVAF